MSAHSYYEKISQVHAEIHGTQAGKIQQAAEAITRRYFGRP